MYIFIVNPHAGSGRGKRIFAKIISSQLYKEIESIYFMTEYKGHAEKIAHDIVLGSIKHIKSIIVVGGDGTLHEVVNGMAAHSSDIPISFIPSGSGNDFARGCSIRKKPLDLLLAIVNEENKAPYWLGNYMIDGEERLFVNSIGFGFDALIAKTANDSPYKKALNIFRIGRINYIIALIRVLRTFKPMDIVIETNGKRKKITGCWTVTVANHPYYGGGMKIIPQAIIQPSTFPILLIHSISKWKILGLFLTVFTGKHTTFKEIELVETAKLKVMSKAANIPYQVDGETAVCESCTITKQSAEIYVMGTGK